MQLPLDKQPMSNRLDRLEARLAKLIEGSLSALIPVGNPSNSLVRELAKAMHVNLEIERDGTAYAPNQYTIQVRPESLLYWQAMPDLLNRLTGYIEQTAWAESLKFRIPPTLHLAANPELPIQQVKVIASFEQEPLEDTAAVRPADHTVETPERKNNYAYLIVNGSDTFLLQQPVINIGRRLDNHLTIDDPRVSRTHAQLRFIRGKYVLFDLNSTGGTFVNGQRISQASLNPGDVISLAGVSLIFGQESEEQTNLRRRKSTTLGQTQSLRYPSEDSRNKQKR